MGEYRPDYGELAKYPFLDEAGKYLRETGFDWKEFSTPELKYIIARAVERIEGALNGVVDMGKGNDGSEVMAFLAALIIVNAIGIEVATRKFSLAEARRAEQFLTADIKNKPRDVGVSLVFRMFKNLFGITISFRSDNDRFAVPVADYLSRASRFHEEEWKLINRPVTSGLVLLDGDETARLIRSELSNLIYSKIKSMNISPVPQPLAEEASKLRQKIGSRYDTRNFLVKEFPPCIKHAMDVMNKGENLPHSARLMLATYLLAIGKSTEEIVEVFRNAPDFSDKITRYQIEHLAGLKGSHTKYSVPSCQRLKIENLCFAIPACDGISNPIQFGRSRGQ